MMRWKTFVYAILAGMCIALGGTVYLMVENRVVGAALFTVGLFAVCTFGFNLYTGKVCYLFERGRSYALDVAVIWLGNLAGTGLTAALEKLTRFGAHLTETAAKVCEAKLSDGMPSLFVLAVFCNIMIFIGVDGYNRNPHELGKYLSLFFGVMVFILCGFEHCVANMYYFSMAGVWRLRTVACLAVMTLGNAVGSVCIPLLRRWKEAK